MGSGRRQLPPSLLWIVWIIPKENERAARSWPDRPWLGGLAIVSIGNTSFGAYMAASRILWGMSDQGMFPQVFKNLQWSSAVVAMLCVLLVAVPDAVFTLATCGSTFLLIAFSACNYSAFVLLKKDGAPITRLLMPATALLFTTSVLVCAFVLETDVRKASMASCVVFGAAIVGSFLVQKEDVEQSAKAALKYD